MLAVTIVTMFISCMLGSALGTFLAKLVEARLKRKD